MKKIDIAQETVDSIINMYLNGNSIKIIAANLHINEKTVSKYLKNNNIEVRKTKITQSLIDQVCSLYSSGLSQSKISDKLNICRKTIREILKSQNVQLKTRSDYKIYNIDENYFNNIDTPNKAYILGLLYADGNVGKNNNLIQIGLQERDVEILKKIQTELKTNQPLVYIQRSSNTNNLQNICLLSVKNKLLHDALILHGVIPRKTFCVKYPNFLSDVLHKHFIRGYLDGDGCIHKTCYAVSMCGTEELCEGIKTIVESYLNIHCTICDTKRNSKIKKINYFWKISSF